MNRTLLPLLMVAALAGSGCARRAANTSTSSAESPPAPSAPAVAQPGGLAQHASEDASQSLAALAARPIYFSLDSATLVPEARDDLERLAQALRQRSLAKVTVAGHTCELGTTEYNVALGQRRADIVRSYLVRLGVEPERISVISYGEERPADESVPDKNRRAELTFHLAE